MVPLTMELVGALDQFVEVKLSLQKVSAIVVCRWNLVLAAVVVAGAAE